MSENITADPAELRARAAAIEKDIALMQQQFGKVDQSTQVMMASWLGQAATSFNAEYTVVKNEHFKTWVNSLTALVAHIRNYADRIEAADNQMM